MVVLPYKNDRDDARNAARDEGGVAAHDADGSVRRVGQLEAAWRSHRIDQLPACPVSVDLTFLLLRGSGWLFRDGLGLPTVFLQTETLACFVDMRFDIFATGVRIVQILATIYLFAHNKNNKLL
jgi:hypothetical protein